MLNAKFGKNTIKKNLRLLLITDTFPPHRTSGAIQLRDLSINFASKGHNVIVLVPSHEIKMNWKLENNSKYRVLRLKSPMIKNLGNARRAINEFLMPLYMLYNFYKCPVNQEKWDGIIWYSPSIFHGLLVRYFKKKYNCKCYLILRDVFPEWAFDLGLIKSGISYQILKYIADYQYKLADTIGIQSRGNEKYLKKYKDKKKCIEVLNNWLNDNAIVKSSIQIKETPLRGRKIFVYAGNMGLAQGIDVILNLILSMKTSDDIGFLFVGRGTEKKRIKSFIQKNNLSNIILHDEIDSEELPDLYSQCFAGIVSLDIKHKSNNVPGKFISYIQNGLPILANIDKENELKYLIEEQKIGQVNCTNNVNDLQIKINKLINQINRNENLKGMCRNLFEKYYSTENAANQIIKRLT